MKQIIVIAIALLLLGGAALFFLTSNTDYKANREEPVFEKEVVTAPTEDVKETESVDEQKEEPAERPSQETIGQSVNGNEITAYRYGKGDTEILFVGGIHGGYSYSTSLVAYELMDYLEENERNLPENVTVTVIPVLNPDGLETVTGKLGRFTAADVTASESERVAARFNANEVDLNRNFDCDWKETSTWRSQTVSGGGSAMSESEAKAISTYVSKNDIAGAVVWFAAEGKVYPSACEDTPSKESVELAATFATAAGYGVEAEFDAYAINGDMVNWMAKENIPAISVLLSQHTAAEWSKNQAGVEAVINYFSAE